MKKVYPVKFKYQPALPWLILISGVMGIALFYLSWDFIYAGQVFPGVYLGELDLSKKTIEDAQQEIQNLVKNLPKQVLRFQSEDKEIKYFLKDFGVVFSASALTKQVVNFGRQPNQPFLNLWQRFRAAIGGVHIPAQYQEQLNLVDQVISKIRNQVDQAGVDGEVIIVGQSANIKSAVTGKILNSTILHQILQKRWQSLLWDPINLPIQLSSPLFNDQITQLTADKINQSLTLKYELLVRDRRWEISPAQLWQWVEVNKYNNTLIVKLRLVDLTNYIEKIKQEADQSVQNAIWEMKNNQVTKFKPDKPGISLRTQDIINYIQSTLLTDQHVLDLPADYIEPGVKLALLNSLGINELVTRGESNFSGSPANRRHNIKVGAAKFNQVLIAPNETVSFNKILGEVDASTGYLPELVIKGDETTPEFGGGLCQVSTTAFRAALNGGYPIIERRNHSYRVSYYEPAGTDATIYPPYPDFKFLNDTQYYILISTWIDGDNLYYDFYSTSTGQRVELEGPRIYNITEPPLPIYIETSQLPEGEERKIDTAHRGAETVLYRHIYNEKGKEIRKDTFKSLYIPWPAKYLIGAKVAPKVEANLGNVPPDITSTEGSPVNLSPIPQT